MQLQLHKLFVSCTNVKIFQKPIVSLGHNENCIRTHPCTAIFVAKQNCRKKLEGTIGTIPDKEQAYCHVNFVRVTTNNIFDSVLTTFLK